MDFDILTLRKTKFVLWAPKQLAQAPLLILGTLDQGVPATFQRRINQPLQAAAGDNAPFLWELPCSSLGLEDGVYHYWFQINDTSPATSLGDMLVTDPFATAVDYRLLQSRDIQPASVIKLAGNELIPCDPSGDVIQAPEQPQQVSAFATNRQLVIYELPVSWTATDNVGRDTGTFKDVLALLDPNARGENFRKNTTVSLEAILAELGVNALELLPLADSKTRFQWGYAPANYFAPDYDLGGSDYKAASNLINLVKYCHKQSIRLISDTVMAFGYDPYVHINYMQFHLRPDEEQTNPDAYQSPKQDPFTKGPRRSGYGGDSWRYDTSIETYDPQTGKTSKIVPAWAFHLAHLAYWMPTFQFGGFRLDSLNNVANWDFIAQFRTDAHARFAKLYPSPANNPDDVSARFLVVGEELSLPFEMITRQNQCVDALWNEQFHKRVRASCVGQITDGEDFGQMVREMIDCRLVGFPRGVNAVNYITNHDTDGDNDGWLRARLFRYLDSKNVVDKEPRCKLAFACLLTAVGIPMIFAGEEFCDQSDEPPPDPYKERDPVNWSRKNSDPWRTNLFKCVARLVALRKRSTAIGGDNVSFIHYDFNNDRRVVAWVRGSDPTNLVVAVANFSDQTVPAPDSSVTGFPDTPTGMKWRNVMSDTNSDDAADQAGQEPLGAWDAKVYELYKPAQ